MKNKVCSLMLFALCLATSLRADNIFRSDVLDSFYPPIERDTHVWLRTDVLLFRPHEKSIVLTNQMTDLFTTADVTLKPNVKPHFRRDVGYRIGCGYIFPLCTWDVAFNWTHFNSQVKQCASTHGDIGLGMFPIWSLANDIIRFDWVATAKMHWKLKVNLLDLEFGKLFSHREQFFLRLAIGLRAASINQNLDVFYGGGIFANGLNLADLDSTFGYDSICMKNHFWGLGPRIGIEPELNLARGWRLYAGAYGALTCGFFDVHQKEIYLKSVRYARKCSLTRCRWMLDATGGIMWKTFCGRDRSALTFALGWEYHLFFKQLALQGDKFGLVSHNRNLSLNGLAFSVHLDC